MTATIENLPEKHRNKIYEFQQVIPVDIFGLCRALDTGYEISVERRKDMPEGISGYILKEGNKCYICCNGNEAWSRQRFTVAHELAHHLLHWNDIRDEYPENFLLRGGLPSKKETEANQLAADILMPDNKIHDYIDQRDEVMLSDMAKHFEVSSQALSIRLGIPLD